MSIVKLVDSIECPEHTGNSIPQAILTATAIGAYRHGNSWPTEDDYLSARPDLPPGWIVSITLDVWPARCGDFERGGLMNSQLAAFMAVADRTYGIPWLYTYASNGAALLSEAARHGWVRGRDFYYWSAHPGPGPHICDSLRCGYPTADGTQCGYLPGNCDISLINDYMLPQRPVVITIPEDENMITSVLDDKGLIHVFVTVPHGADLSKGCTVFELYQKPANAGWTGGATGKQKALAYPLARIPENVG